MTKQKTSFRYFAIVIVAFILAVAFGIWLRPANAGLRFAVDDKRVEEREQEHEAARQSGRQGGGEDVEVDAETIPAQVVEVEARPSERDSRPKRNAFKAAPPSLSTIYEEGFRQGYAKGLRDGDEIGTWAHTQE